MAEIQNFRSALGGFNREDVVRYIEYMNNKHSAELEQLNNQLQAAREALSQAKAQGDVTQLKTQLEEAQARCQELEAQLAEAQACAEAPQEAAQAVQTPAVSSADELEAYRRAERAERLARDRAAQIYAQANAALADATVKVETISEAMTDMADRMAAQAQDAKNKLQDAVASLYAIRPEEE